ncbi:hypothetical protein ACFQVC_18415 [Streptomyces monticola]|uniref:Lipoprotein n=1 Tax=Streptomyces monticola TaxID=2666263 RepID=A0ABW2JL26_9ACTN
MSRHPFSVRAACGALLGVLLLSGCAEREGLYVQGPAIKPSPATGPVYVADAMGQPLRRPTSVGLTEFTGLSDLRWGDWGGATARATGKLSGNWCLPGCAEKPYDVTVTLSGLEKQERVAYYRRATIVPDRPEELPPSAVKVQLQGIRLSVPAF